jgi:glutathione S-transferase
LRGAFEETLWESNCTIIPLSTYSRRVRIAFAEKQIPHELVVVDMAARRHREQPYLSLNPYGRVPTLEDDGYVLFESTAILNYLETMQPLPALVPTDARRSALVDMHMKLCDLQFARQAGTIQAWRFSSTCTT